MEGEQQYWAQWLDIKSRYASLSFYTLLRERTGQEEGGGGQGCREGGGIRGTGRGGDKGCRKSSRIYPDGRA